VTDEPQARSRAITALYVPGDRADRFEKAYASGADMVIVDLEDSVAPASKEAARQAAVEWISGLTDRQHSRVAIQVRVNAGDEADLRAVAGLPLEVGVRVPKVENGAQLDAVAALVGNRPLTALLESSLGIENAALVASHPAVTALALGESDLASELGSVDPAVMEYIRIRTLVAARAAGLPAPMLSAYPDIADLDGLRADTERGRRLGCVGRTAVHPSQLAVIREVFAPSAEEVEWAHAVLAALEGGGVTTLASGEMVDVAMAGRARSILEL
jgi:citrate lyase subunit beta / citryl-CoA lyase